VRITIVDGYVTLDAKDATIRQILDEWARVGQTRIVNGERVSGPPVTLQLTRVPEGEALDVVLRSVSGYMAAPRAAVVPNASRFDRILVMPTSTPPRVTAPPQPAPQTFQPTAPIPDDQDVDEPPAGAPGQPAQRAPFFPQFPGGPGQAPAGNLPQRGPVFPPQNTPFPQPQQVPMPIPGAAPPVLPAGSPAGAPPAVVPGGMPAGVATPGMVVQPPTQPGQPGAAAPEPQR
jgi:hypothetical protein